MALSTVWTKIKTGGLNSPVWTNCLIANILPSSLPTYIKSCLTSEEVASFLPTITLTGSLKIFLEMSSTEAGKVAVNKDLRKFGWLQALMIVSTWSKKPISNNRSPSSKIRCLTLLKSISSVSIAYFNLKGVEIKISCLDLVEGSDFMVAEVALLKIETFQRLPKLILANSFLICWDNSLVGQIIKALKPSFLGTSKTFNKGNK